MLNVNFNESYLSLVLKFILQTPFFSHHITTMKRTCITKNLAQDASINPYLSILTNMASQIISYCSHANKNHLFLFNAITIKFIWKTNLKANLKPPKWSYLYISFICYWHHMFNMRTIIQMHIWHCEMDKSPIELLYPLGLEHNINNLKGENMWCQTSYHSPMCEHSCTY
jgi:hypothetical protein